MDPFPGGYIEPNSRGFGKKTSNAFVGSEGSANLRIEREQKKTQKVAVSR